MFQRLVFYMSGKESAAPQSLLTASKSSNNKGNNNNKTCREKADEDEDDDTPAGGSVEDTGAQPPQELNQTIHAYLDNFNREGEERGKNYKNIVNDYYSLVSDFYEIGWGQSFHFAPRFKEETFEASLARHEHYMALQLGLGEGGGLPGANPRVLRIADIGCGVGGPMRAIARFVGGKGVSEIVGITINQYQVDRGNYLNKKYGMVETCRLEQGNFMELKAEYAETFDAAYAIESTCHAPDRTAAFKQIHKILKAGGTFACFEWVLTPLYDANNPEHARIKHEIEKGDGLPGLARQGDVERSMEAAGFVVDKSCDMALDSEVPWYATLQGRWGSRGEWRHTRAGRFTTQCLVDVLETVRVAPKGTSQTHRMLCAAADALVRGGELGIFTPMMFVRGRKVAVTAIESE